MNMAVMIYPVAKRLGEILLLPVAVPHADRTTSGVPIIASPHLAISRWHVDREGDGIVAP